MLEFGWFGILQTLGALALFIYGLKVMSEGMQRMASIQFRDALQRVTGNKFSAFITGFLTTAAVQSSSAITILTISFVNAGIISLMAAAGIIIGANLGTVVTIWMVTILGFELNLFTLCLPLIAIAMPFFFIKNGRYRHWAETIIGFSILLISIEFLKSVVPDLQKHQDVMTFLGEMSDHGALSTLLFILIGIVFTALIQSSSAAITLTLTLCLTELLPFEIAIAMVMGENIGTTITTEIASWVGNVKAKIAARIHLLFNVVGVVWTIAALPVILPAISWIMTSWFGTNDPYTDPAAMPVGIAIFYTFFNLTNGILFFILMPELAALSSKSVKKVAHEEQKQLLFLDTGSNTADLTLPIAKQEILQQCMRIKSLNKILNTITTYISESEFAEHHRQKDDYLHTLAKNQTAIDDYLTGLVEDKSSLLTSKQIKSLLHINILIDGLRSSYENIFQLVEEKRNHRFWFSPTQRSILLHKINDADLMLKICIQLISSRNTDRQLWRTMMPNLSDRESEYLEFEKEVMKELERGEMKLASVVLFHKISHLLDQINDALDYIFSEITEELNSQRMFVGV